MPSSKDKEKQKRNFFVYIVESPSPVDLYYNRSEGELLMKALSLANILSSHKLTVNLEAFKASITIGFQSYLKRPNVPPPLLHISAHGSETGIQLASEEVVSWEMLRNLLMPINKALNGMLILCMSSCKGFNACRMAMKKGELPFFGVIGNVGDPTWSDTAIAYLTFYHLLSNGYPVVEAVKSMCSASGDDGFKEILSTKAREIYIEEIKKINIRELTEQVTRNISKIPESPLVKELRKNK